MKLTKTTRPLWQRFLHLADELMTRHAEQLGPIDFPPVEVRHPALTQPWYYKFLIDDSGEVAGKVLNMMPGRAAFVSWLRGGETQTEADFDIAIAMAHLIQLVVEREVEDIPEFRKIIKTFAGELSDIWQPGKAMLYYQKGGVLLMPVGKEELRQLIAGMEGMVWLGRVLASDAAQMQKLLELPDNQMLRLTFDEQAERWQLEPIEMDMDMSELYYFSPDIEPTPDQQRRLEALPLDEGSTMAIAVRPSPPLITEEGKTKIHFLATALWEGDIRPQMVQVMTPEQVHPHTLLDELVKVFEEHGVRPASIIVDTQLAGELCYPLKNFGIGIFRFEEEGNPIFQMMDSFLGQAFEFGGEWDEASDN